MNEDGATARRDIPMRGLGGAQTRTRTIRARRVGFPPGGWHARGHVS